MAPHALPEPRLLGPPKMHRIHNFLRYLPGSAGHTIAPNGRLRDALDKSHVVLSSIADGKSGVNESGVDGYVPQMMRLDCDFE